MEREEQRERERIPPWEEREGEVESEEKTERDGDVTGRPGD